MQKTTIEWTDYSWNPITGCLKGCDYCYARKVATRFAGGSSFPKGFEPTFHPERLSEHFPKKSSKIFTCSMGELFGDWLPAWQVEDVFATIRAYPQHTFQILTKQPQNLIKWSPFPENSWVGVSVCNDKMLDVAVDKLEDIQAKVKFISFEPLLERLTLSLDYALYFSGITWVIIGAQTPHSEKTAPKTEWIKAIIDAADKVGIPVFLKNNLGLPKYSCEGGMPFYKHHPTGTMELRQEFPNSKREVTGVEG